MSSSTSNSDSKNHIVRLFWPCNLLQRVKDQDAQACILLGFVIHCKPLHGNKLVVAAVVDWCCPSLAQAKPINAHNVSISVQDQHLVATLAAVGFWSSHASAVPAPDLKADHGTHTGLWLVLEDALQCRDLLSSDAGSNSKRQLQQLPSCCIDQSQLPSGTSSVQVKLQLVQT